MSNYLAYTNISKVAFDHYTTYTIAGTGNHRRVQANHIHTHITDGSKEEKGTLPGARFFRGNLIASPTQFI